MAGNADDIFSSGMIGATQEVRLHLGCGTVYLPGYVNIDAYPTSERGGTVVRPDRLMRVEQLDYPPSSVDEIYTAHALEHLAAVEVEQALLCWYRILKPGGRLIIELPDAEAIMRALLRQKTDEDKDLYYFLLFGTQEFEGEFHKGGYTFSRLRRLLEAVGFEEFVNVGESPTCFANTPCYEAFRGRAWRCVLLSCRKLRNSAEPDRDKLHRLLFFEYDGQDLPYYRFRRQLAARLGPLRFLISAVRRTVGRA